MGFRVCSPYTAVRLENGRHSDITAFSFKPECLSFLHSIAGRQVVLFILFYPIFSANPILSYFLDKHPICPIFLSYNFPALTFWILNFPACTFWVVNLFPRTHFLVVNSNLSECYANFSLNFVLSFWHNFTLCMKILLAPAVTEGTTEWSMESASVRFFTTFVYNFVKKWHRITICGIWVTSRWIMDRLKYFKTEFNTLCHRRDWMMLRPRAIHEHFIYVSCPIVFKFYTQHF